MMGNGNNSNANVGLKCRRFGLIVPNGWQCNGCRLLSGGRCFLRRRRPSGGRRCRGSV